MKKMTMALIGLAAVAIIATALYYKYYSSTAMIKAELQKIVDQDAGYAETLLLIAVDSKRATYKEVFALCEKIIADRMGLMMQLRSISPGKDIPARQQILDYFAKENDWVRALNDLYQSRMALLNEPYSSPHGEREIYRENSIKRASKAADDATQAFSLVVEEEAILVQSTGDTGVRITPVYERDKNKISPTIAAAKRTTEEKHNELCRRSDAIEKEGRAIRGFICPL